MAGFVTMAVTPNYGWPVPVATDYVKDGYEAIADLGDAIDATVFGLPSGALTLISATTVGTAVASVTVSNCFSATYDNYKIIYVGGSASTTSSTQMTLSGLGSVYELSIIRGNTRSSSLTNGFSGGSAAYWQVNSDNGSPGPYIEIELFAPFLTKQTVIRGWGSAFATSNIQEVIGGFAGSTLSSTGFTFTASSGTFTGGTIAVYGYQK
jgi:hypothetical protein